MKCLLARGPIAAGTLLLIAALNTTASAALVTFTQAMSGFTHDSDTVSAPFNAALGGSYTHISFNGASSADGTSYSPAVTFSTKVGAFGGSNTSSVNFNADEIGPFGTWDGILNIAFTNPVSVAGFGIVEFDSAPEVIRVYGAGNVLLGTFNNQLSNTFSLWGVQATAGEQITRIELDGNFFAIQDISFTQSGATGVPDTGSTLACFALGMLCLAGLKKRALGNRRK